MMVVTLGRVTNVALAVAKTLHLVKSVSCCVVRVILAMLSEMLRQVRNILFGVVLGPCAFASAPVCQ